MDSQNPKAYFLLAQLHLQRGEPELASGLCENVIGLFSQQKEIRLIFGLSEFHLQRWKSAEQNLKACEEEYSQEPDWLWAYFQTLMALEKYEEATELYKKMKEAMPEHDYLKRELILLEALKGDAENAIQLFSLLQEENVENSLVKSRVLKMAGNQAMAIKEIQKFKSDERALFYWLSLKLEQGVIDEFPKELEGRSFSREAWLNLGALAEKSNRYDFAVQLYETALRDYQDDAMLWNNYAWNAHKSKSYKEKALPSIERALALNDNDLNIIDTYAYVLLDHKKFQKCQEFLETKPNFTIASPRLLFALGKCYEENLLNQMAKEKYLESIRYSKGKEWDLPIEKESLLEKVDGL
jgi:tetratricopeptide (TPR) repeat protein